jgi:hypothetical protein
MFRSTMPTNVPRMLAHLALLGALLAPAAAWGKEHPPFAARTGLDLAQDAAHSWAEDAHLVYLENDEAVTALGRAPRWGYLFYSPSRDRSRGYSIEDGEIVAAADLGFRLQAPPVEVDWIDSDAALVAAEHGGGAEYTNEHGGHLRTMLLMRGAFHPKNPDRTTWTFVYDAPGQPSLFIVVDAASGTVVRRWKG